MNDTLIAIILDEFANLQHFSVAIEAAARLRGCGVTMLFCVQNLGQMRAIYGTEADALQGCCGTVTYMGGTNDLTTAETLSKLCGTMTIHGQETSVSSRPDGGVTTSTNTQSRSVLTPDEVARLPLPRQLIIAEGKGAFTAQRIDPSLRRYARYQAFMAALNSGHGIEAAKQAALAARDVVYLPAPKAMAALPAPEPKPAKPKVGRLEAFIAKRMGHVIDE